MHNNVLFYVFKISWTVDQVQIMDLSNISLYMIHPKYFSAIFVQVGCQIVKLGTDKIMKFEQLQYSYANLKAVGYYVTPTFIP